MSTPTAYRTCESVVTRPQTKFRIPRKERINQWMLHDLIKQPLETISHPALQGTEGHIVPQGLKYIGSYNWIDVPTPTIIVPGQSAVLPVTSCSEPQPPCRVSSNMGGEAHTLDCPPRQRPEFHRSKRLPHEEIHTPASHRSRAGFHGPQEQGHIQVRLVFSRFHRRLQWPAEARCMGKQKIRPLEDRHSTSGK